MRLKTCFASIILLLALLGGGVPRWLHSAEQSNPIGTLIWVPIPKGAEVATLVDKEVRRLVLGGTILPFERTTRVFENWVTLKRSLLADWRDRFHKRREMFRQTLLDITEHAKNYREIINRISLAENALQSFRQRIRFLDDQLQSLQNEQKIIEQNFQTQLDGFGFQIIFHGSVRQKYKSPLPQDHLRTQLGLAMNVKAIRELDETLVQITDMILDQELLSTHLTSELEGRSETTATYPISISKVWRENNASIGTISHLFQVITVYPFYSRKTAGDIYSKSETLSLLNSIPEINPLTKINLQEVLFENGIDDNNLEHFLESWLSLITETNESTMRRLQELRNTFQSQRLSLKSRMQALKKERALKLCEIIHLRWQLHGPTEKLAQTWPVHCGPTGESKNLLDAKAHWETHIWSEMLREFQETHQEYVKIYSSKIVAFEKVSDGKSQPGEKPTDTWIRIAQNSFDTLHREISAQDYKEDILIIGQRLSDYQETTVTYRKIPIAFTILYLADHESDNQVAQIVGIGVKYRFESERTYSIPPPVISGVFYAPKTKCDLRQLEQMFDYNIPLENIAKRCGLATSIDIPPDQEMWALVKHSSLMEEIQEFIRTYPKSPLIPSAKLKLQQIKRTRNK